MNVGERGGTFDSVVGTNYASINRDIRKNVNSPGFMKSGMQYTGRESSTTHRNVRPTLL